MLQTIRKLLAPLTLVALVGFAGGAQANNAISSDGTYHFGVLNISQGVSVNGIEGDFTHTFSFIQGAFPAVTGALSGLDADGDMKAEYGFGYGETPTGGPATWFGWSGLALVPSDEDGAFAFSQTMTGLAPGTLYWFGLRGEASLATYTLTLAPVPEPESWALMLAGLGLMGFIARRRQVAAA